jgi:hypothetical protein
VDRDYKVPRLARQSMMGQSFVKAKTGRRKQAQEFPERRQNGELKRTVKLKKDYTIKPDLYQVVEVECAAFADEPEGEWILGKTLLADSDDSFFPVPNTLMTSSTPMVPMANTSALPRRLRKGEIVGIVVSTDKFFDKPKGLDDLESLQKRTNATILTINALREEDAKKASGVSEEPGAEAAPARESRGLSSEAPRGSDDAGGDTDAGGPKTAVMPETEVYAPKDLRKLIDVGDLPEHLHEKAWTMLEKNADTFGFDGRLGHHPTQAKIRLKEGIDPIAVPMYSTSPKKKEVIEEQLKKSSNHRRALGARQ